MKSLRPVQVWTHSFLPRLETHPFLFLIFLLLWDFILVGFVADSEHYSTLSIQEVVSEYGKDFDWDLKVRTMGMTRDSICQMIIETLALPLSLEEFLEKVLVAFARHMPSCQLLPGANLPTICHVVGRAVRAGH